MNRNPRPVSSAGRLILPAATALLALSASLPASAQSGLNEHVAVDGRYLPEVTRTERLRSSLAPIEMKFGTDPTEADLSGEAVDFSPASLPMMPTVWKGGHPVRPRGYVDFALGSWLKGYLLAGVKAIDKENLQLGIRFDGRSNLLYRPEEALYRRRHLDGTLGVDLVSRFEERGTLSASAQYRLGWFNYDLLRLSEDDMLNPYLTENPASPTQTVNDAALRLRWASERDRSLRWKAGAGLRYFGYRDLPFSTLTPTRETSVRIDGGVDGDVGLGSTESDWGVGGALSLNTYSGDIRPSTNGLLTLTPAWNISRPFDGESDSGLRWEARIGAKVDFSFNHRGPAVYDLYSSNPESGRLATSGERFGFLHIAPDVSASLSNGTIGAYFRAAGGVEEQTLAALSGADLYTAPFLTGSLPAYTPADLRVGVTLSPGAGVTATLEGRWKSTRSIYAGGLWTLQLAYFSRFSSLSTATEWASPYYSLHGYSVRFATEWKGWRFLEAKGELTWQPQRHATGWFNGYGRPEWTALISLTSNPWKGLKVKARWELRALRSVTVAEDLRYAASIPLPNLSDLSAGVSYDFTERLTVGVRLTNILNRRTALLPGYVSEGFGATAGLQFLF